MTWNFQVMYSIHWRICTLLTLFQRAIFRKFEKKTLLANLGTFYHLISVNVAQTFKLQRYATILSITQFLHIWHTSKRHFLNIWQFPPEDAVIAKNQMRYCAEVWWFSINTLGANPTKWSNTLKQIAGNSRRIVWVCYTIWCWHLKGQISKSKWWCSWYLTKKPNLHQGTNNDFLREATDINAPVSVESGIWAVQIVHSYCGAIPPWKVNWGTTKSQGWIFV